eukprot:Skav212383  [mRNA]  locus=scaffold45:35154:41223:- [translate_table: standard]
MVSGCPLSTESKDEPPAHTRHSGVLRQHSVVPKLHILHLKRLDLRISQGALLDMTRWSRSLGLQIWLKFCTVNKSGPLWFSRFGGNECCTKLVKGGSTGGHGMLQPRASTATICSVAPKAPRLSPSPVPFENCTIPELWLPEAGSTDDEYEVSATGFMTGPSWDLQELSSCGYRGERFSVQLPSSVCSTRCSSPGGMSSTDSPWPANCDKRESMCLGLQPVEAPRGNQWKSSVCQLLLVKWRFVT